MKALLKVILPSLATICLLDSFSQAQTTGFNQTGGGPFDYSTPGNWVDETINGIWDSSLVLTASQTVTFAANTSLLTDLQIGYDANSVSTNARNLTFRADGGPFTLTLGGDVTISTVQNETLTFGSTTANQVLNVNLGGVTRTLTAKNAAGSSRTMTFQNVISNGGVITNGGTINFNGANTYTGDTTVTSGTLALNGATGSSADSNFTVKGGGSSTSTLQFNSTTSGNTGTTRANSVTLDGSGSTLGAFLTVSGNATANSLETIDEALTVSAGYATIGVTANAASAAQLTADSFVRNAGSSVLFRGSNLGVAAIGDQIDGHANIHFANAPALVGAGTANQTTIGILKGAYGDVTSNGVGAAGGLVTYDSTYGVRLLNAGTEYASTIVDGQTTLDNVLLARASGGASQDINLTETMTTIGSLSFQITGAGTNSGAAISGNAETTLRISSGVVFASQQVTAANATDAMTLSVPMLDLNGTEGVITVFSNGISNGNTAAPLFISSEITNDGGNGVTFGGTGQTQLTGTAQNSYTGVTTLNSGVLRLAKTGAAAANTLATDLIMNGGTLLKNNNSIADGASVTIHGGSFVMDTTTSSGNNGSSETIENLTMTGGRVQGSGGSSSVLTINGDMALSGGLVQLNTGGDVLVGGHTTLNGGVLNARLSSSTTLFTGLTTLNTLSIENVASGTYTPIVLTGHATNKGALLTLNGNVTFTGNGTNTNTVRIDSSDLALANQGVIALEGTRSFTIGNGAAIDDLSIVPTMQDGTVAGGLTKLGEGTLALSGANTYTGATTIGEGTLALRIGGSITDSAEVNVNAGAILDTTAQSFTMLGGQTFEFTLDATGSGSAGLLNAGVLDITFGNVTFNIMGMLDDNVYVIASYTSLTGANFDSAGPVTGYTIDYNYLGGNQIALTVIPEPSTFAMVLAGLGLLVGFQRSRRRR